MWSLPSIPLRPLIWTASVFLSACAAAPVKPDPKSGASPPPESVTPSPSPRQHTVSRLLSEAEFAMSQSRFSLPVHDNAHDRFRAVLLLDPGNKRAQAGLHGILLVYVDRIQQSLGAGRFQAAAADLRLVDQLFPGADLLQPLRVELQRRVKAAAAAAETPAPTDGRERVPLPAQPLADKTDEVMQLLVQLAHRVRQSDESIMIYARTDAEGRWIYKAMKDAVGDYRIRGDIRITQQPAIELLSPLE